MTAVSSVDGINIIVVGFGGTIFYSSVAGPSLLIDFYLYLVIFFIFQLIFVYYCRSIMVKTCRAAYQ